jgi:hypothetical protein
MDQDSLRPADVAPCGGGPLGLTNSTIVRIVGARVIRYVKAPSRTFHHVVVSSFAKTL